VTEATRLRHERHTHPHFPAPEGEAIPSIAALKPRCFGRPDQILYLLSSCLRHIALLDLSNGAASRNGTPAPFPRLPRSVVSPGRLLQISLSNVRSDTARRSRCLRLQLLRRFHLVALKPAELLTPATDGRLSHPSTTKTLAEGELRWRSRYWYDLAKNVSNYTGRPARPPDLQARVFRDQLSACWRYSALYGRDEACTAPFIGLVSSRRSATA